MIERELTYLAKSLPENLASFPFKEILDIYIPSNATHPNLRIRKNGEKFEITRKEPLSDKDFSTQSETTIPLSKDEFLEFAAIPGKRVRKLRHFFPYQDHTAEIDVFQDDLAGLVLVDIEFITEDAKTAVTMPEFCLVDVTQEEVLAGGCLAGKFYANIEPTLKHYGYSPL